MNDRTAKLVSVPSSLPGHDWWGVQFHGVTITAADFRSKETIDQLVRRMNLPTSGANVVKATTKGAA